MRLIERIKSNFATPKTGNEKLLVLLSELRDNPVDFNIQKIDQEGETYFLAESKHFKYGYITTTGATLTELQANIKDAIFTSFDVPKPFCKPELINLANWPLDSAQRRVYATT